MPNSVYAAIGSHNDSEALHYRNVAVHVAFLCGFSMNSERRPALAGAI